MDIGNLYGMDIDQNEALLFFSDSNTGKIYRKNYRTNDEAAAIKHNVWGE